MSLILTLIGCTTSFMSDFHILIFSLPFVLLYNFVCLLHIVCLYHLTMLKDDFRKIIFYSQ